ncbi:putative HTH-type transcriptional regulator YdfH [Roseovarius sp. THAF8]|uniref:GntR family transcriptional regulator n=1 Tax=Roseovarius sp. THAF8 TaxID=2587846 RepID=UPI0012687C09|nr:GntR family transcriptional regulator [Roseovarius sp. THAF8]QFT99117.1 putative HTH-type transcriptional regulator YdfH [Roseovarius sp. THAF8]
MKLNPIDTSVTLKDHIYNRMREAILEMDIYSDSVDLRLDERSLADQLGVSRTPLREVLVRLEQEGLLEVRPRRGIFVQRKTLSDILEMIIAWAALESMAARLACERATDREITSLRTIAAKYSVSKTGADIAEYSDDNIRFHQKILEISGCELLSSMAENLFVHMHAVRRRSMAEEDRVPQSVADHMEIIEAMEARDADLAGARVRDHTMRLHDHVREVWTRAGITKNMGE